MGGPGSGKARGTGSPLYFQCANCRRSAWWKGKDRGRIDRIELTGSVRTIKRVGHDNGRSTDKAYQYKCMETDCRNIGRSQHIELHLKAEAEKKAKAS